MTDRPIRSRERRRTDLGIEHVLAVVPVADIDAAQGWYERLLGRSPDNEPMPGLVEWQVVDAGWVQLTQDGLRAGTGLLNLAVEDIEAHAAELAARGLEPGPIETVSKGVRLAALHDPDGTVVTLIGSFRVRY